MKETNSTGFFVGGLLTLLAGAAIYWFLSVWVGVFLVLVAEILFVMPKTTLRNAVVRENAELNKMALKVKIKDADKAEKAVNVLYKVCFILAVVSFVVLIGMIYLASYLGAM